MGEKTEKGLIYFFYRPKVGNEEVSSAADVQKLYILLAPKIGTVAPYTCCQYVFGIRLLTWFAKQLPMIWVYTYTLGEAGKEKEIGHKKHRLIVITRKKLPEIHERSRYWGFVETTDEEASLKWYFT